ncbi:hypothetical protein UPYG_G00095500 [Umbra pygmaea]|uniref:Ig-like domain-containing protein n=1 Tax=Umbra pygmaea TaxID=75934 RepID=A0ABD0WZQ8_UMBPY
MSLLDLLSIFTMVKGFVGYLTLVVLMFTGWHTHASSIIELNPPRAVVRYGDSVSVKCSKAAIGHQGMGWEAKTGGVGLKENVNSIIWTVENLTDWTVEPKCYFIRNDGKQYLKVLPVILYKTPDIVSISPLNHSDLIVEGNQYQLQCNIQKVAPLQNLVVKWYKGHESIEATTYRNSSNKTPVNVSPTFTINPSREDDGAQFRCEAELHLGPGGPQTPPTVTSELLNVIVLSPPKFFNPEAEVQEVRAGDKINLNCTASGNPTPVYNWTPALDVQNNQMNKAVLTLSSELAGTYNCTASNNLGTIRKTFTVHLTPNGHSITFWVIIGSGVCLALGLCVCYAVVKMKTGPESII